MQKILDTRDEQIRCIKRIIEEKNVRFIVLQLADILGSVKSTTLPVNQIDKILNNEIMFDGSSIDGFTRIEESDMYLYPDLSTFVLFPWPTHNGYTVARMICDVYTPNGEPFEGCPRNVLKKALKKACDMGYTFYVGPEPEFYMFNVDEKGNPVLENNDKAGYFDMAPMDKGESVREAITIALEGFGFEVEASHHEGGPGQHEIDFKYADALTTADNIMTFKYVVKKIADDFGLFATFMPKPVEGIAGSGMHLNMSLFEGKENIFYDKNKENGLSDEAMYFIGGLLKNAKGFAAITNPLINSYKRLTNGFEAPVNIAWSEKNRSPLVRVPAKRGLSTRVELRNPDPSCNPYLALAIALTAGLDGIANKIVPPQPINRNIYEMGFEERQQNHIESLPKNIYEALMELSSNDLIKGALGSHITNKFTTAKFEEWKDYTMKVHEWEIDQYLRAY
ncbi:type I glutamate--ammonia ligase [Schnuerera sp. xch1]|uniref:type I glutamate--ammonia ligase n=1 Tax=Schnuerera sp. xch1 TaxID=2874283 RepID=UPI001CBD7BAC|nr:type I glutamate--ammonia ligase [Schnuerera sp. xch1]MBZ2175488.1 type I glutamate--ammonia ligase [Schnuerera sp. xch1]